jgi:diguanylate cyclase (GGDEF)-like protein
VSSILQKQRQQARLSQARLYAVSFGLLAAAVGILGGGGVAPMVTLGAIFGLLYLLAERQGWLLKALESRGGRDYAVTAVFATVVVLFVLLTGGAKSPMPCALYLPVLLASLCYGIEFGLAASLAMIVVAAFLATGGALPHHLPPLRMIAIGLSFPVVAVFGGALRAQMESRLRALGNEKEDLSALLDMSQMMDSAYDLDMTLNLILLNIQEHSDCLICAVYLKSDDGRTLELRAASGTTGPVTLLPALTLDDACGGGWSLTGTYRDDLQVHAFHAASAQAIGAEKTSRLFEIDPSAESFTCLPLATGEALLGMLYVSYDRPNGLTAEGVHRLEQLAARAAFPLGRLLLQQDFRSLAYSDSMTGLDNFRQFENNLADELARAERYHRPLSVILLDIDHFKSFNDTLGHQAGDALLGQLGIVLRNALRNVDKPARYGGEEFIIICPETSKEETRLIAERIRQNVADTLFVLPNKDGEKNPEDSKRGGETARVTISLGCATFPGDAHAARELVKKADIALYAAKKSGRNRVCVYDGSEEAEELVPAA